MFITVLFLASCSYCPRSWSERRIREIVREELEIKDYD